MKAPLARLAALLAISLSVAIVVACTPAERQDARDVIHAATPIIESGCVVLKIAHADGTLQEVCVLAEDLARFADQQLASQSEAPRDAGSVALAFAMPVAVRAPRGPPKRHCAQWTYVDGGAPRDAAANDARASPATDGGSSP